MIIDTKKYADEIYENEKIIDTSDDAEAIKQAKEKIKKLILHLCDIAPDQIFAIDEEVQRRMDE